MWEKFKAAWYGMTGEKFDILISLYANLIFGK
jgi:hypothetical protein